MTFTDILIKVPSGMTMYLKPKNKLAELERNALILYPCVKDTSISHGRAAEILRISKYELIVLYDNLGLAYLSCDISEAEDEVLECKKLRSKSL